MLIALLMNLAVVLSWLVLGTAIDYAQGLVKVPSRRR